MSERPILMSAPMVRAILDDRKTQTRRLVKLPLDASEVRPAAGAEAPSGTFVAFWREPGGEERGGTVVRCPYGQPGDLLYVRETFWGRHDMDCGDYGAVYFNGPALDLGAEFHPGIDLVATPACFDPPQPEREQTVERWTGPPAPGEWWLAPPDHWNGKEDEERVQCGVWSFLPWPQGQFTKHPSIHMPKWAARLWLEIVEVRVERLQEISEEDAKAEGVDPLIPGEGPVTLDDLRCDPGMRTPRMFRDGFAYAWSSLHDKPADFGESWKANPWVWVVTFCRTEAPSLPLPTPESDRDREEQR